MDDRAPSAGEAGLAAISLCDAGVLTFARGRVRLDRRAAAILGMGSLDQTVGTLRRLRFRSLAPLLARLRSLRSGEPAGPCALVFVDAAGESRHLDVAVVRSAAGAALVMAITDVTEQRRALAEVRTTLKTVPSAMVVIDERGLIRAFSATAEQMFGYTAAQVIGRPVDLLMPEPHRSEHKGYVDRYLATGASRVVGRSRHLQARRADGSTFPAEIWIGDAVTDGERLFTGFLRDQTLRLEVEAKLQDMQNNLAHAARLSAMGELSLALAHELNQPLATLVNYLAVAHHQCAGLTGDSAAQVRETLAETTRQAMRAGEIVKRLRAFVERGEAELNVEGVDRIVGDAVALLASLAQRRGIALQVTMPGGNARVLADRIQIQQVLVNLIRNAVQALERKPGGEQVLRVSAAAGGEEVEFAVEDNGPGVDPALEPMLFTRFSTTSEGGMGLGLSISRRIVEAHGARLRYRRVPTGGARFSFVLPVWREGRDDDR